MTELFQGDLIRIAGFKSLFMVVSRNSFIRATGLFHVCPLLQGVPEGALHIAVTGRQKTSGTVICEQIKLIDPQVRDCTRIDSLPHDMIMNISDALQGMLEYD
ncbi:MAG: hypothetical protein J5865_05130 [Lachnospiraceae bacterium]|nr:hypothetical protein [Lachnospiraceae bacterium]